MRQGALGVSALISADLYAFATGVAAFAGDREMATLRLLNIMPVDRCVVWSAKVSFALVITLGLTLVLVAMAAAYTDQCKPQGSLSVWEVLSCGMILLSALGWGLLWSAIVTNALAAAVIAILSTRASSILLTPQLDNAPLDLSLFVITAC